MPSAFLNFTRFNEARLQAVLFRKTYSEQGLVEWIGSVPLHVCHFWIVLSYCNPGRRRSTRPGDLLEEFGGIFLFERLSGGDGLGPPFPAIDRGLHEFVGDADGKVLVLELDAAIGLPVERPVVALVDQGPGLFLLQGLAVDELFDVPVPVTDGIHLGGAAGLAARLHDGGDPVVDLKE